MQSNAKCKNGFQHWDSCFWISWIFTVRLGDPKRIWKTVLKNSGLSLAHVISKMKTAVHENILQILFRISQLISIRKSMKTVFGFLNWNPPWGWISQRWNPFSDFVFDCKIPNPDLKKFKFGFPNQTQPKWEYGKL